MEPEIQTAESHGLSRFKVESSHPEGALKVLVVEDNAELKIYIYNSLAGKYEVRDASNGKEALQVIASGWLPDIIVTDLMMPEMDGIELINHVRNDFNTSHIPIVMITAKHEDDTHLKAMKYGADGYIAKPFTMELLMARIDNMLERRKALVSKISEHKKVDISPEEIVITDKDEQMIKKLMLWLEEHVADAEVTVDQLAAYVGMGRTSMYNKIKGLTGKSPVELIQDFRMEKATYYLKSGQYSVSETSYKVGFSDPGYFSRSFKKHFGMSPAEYIKQNKNS
jgi:YesN/AraC family two-component response regulator